MSPLRQIEGNEQTVLTDGWELVATDPGTASDPAALVASNPAWLPALVPGTAASSLRAAGAWSLDGPPRRFDAQDYWYRCRFETPAQQDADELVLCLDGLATIADIWLNGRHLLRSENMFVARCHDITHVGNGRHGRNHSEPEPVEAKPAGERLCVGIERHDRKRSESEPVEGKPPGESPCEGENELYIRFSALDPLLAARRPRPRWRAPMVENQQLRWFRTTLLGRTPGWSPPAAAVGPWRSVRLERRRGFAVGTVLLRPHLEGADGLLSAEIEIRPLEGAHLTGGRLCVSRNGRRFAAACKIDSLAVDTHGDRAWGEHVRVQSIGGEPARDRSIGGQLARAVSMGGEPARDERIGGEHIRNESAGEGAGVLVVRATVRIPDVALWWPHTHGDQPLYDVSWQVTIDGTERAIDCGRAGFRSLSLDTANGAFSLSVNNVPIFCRGACWTPLDVVTLAAPAAAIREALDGVRAAGMNMVRVAGTMVYEDDHFYDLCDELGILVWHDFMFANMDYPEGDSSFLASVREECEQALRRWQGRPSLAVLCGDSEGEQQAAMWGAPRAEWNRTLFREVIPEICARLMPDLPYWPSSASGGAFPHQPNAGTTSYYGVGAYLRPGEDARRSEVRFASECLAFANIPDERTLDALGGGRPPRLHHAAWKARTPRDLGAGWDFDDVRDHYVQRLFGLDPVTLRHADHDRYVELGRVVTGEVMAAALGEWRRRASTCRGALIWFLRDLWEGAGWGLIDARGRPKAAYQYVARALQPVTVFLTDEGLNGLVAHVINDCPEPLAAELRIDLFRRGELRVGGGSALIEVPAHGGSEHPVASLLEGFSDTTHAYRFGPPSLDLAVASLLTPGGERLADAFSFPLGPPAQQESDLGLQARAEPLPQGGWDLTVRTRRFAQAIALDVGDLGASDNYFHLPPGGSRTLTLTARPSVPAPSRGHAKALNADSAVSFTLTRHPDEAQQARGIPAASAGRP